MTIEMCLDICRGKEFPFSGLEWSCECHCGHEPEGGFEWAWSNKCNDRCAGDSDQLCGGSNALSLWTTPPKNPKGLCINDYPENQRVLNDFSITGLQNMTIEYCCSICEGESEQICSLRGDESFLLRLWVLWSSKWRFMLLWWRWLKIHTSTKWRMQSALFWRCKPNVWCFVEAQCLRKRFNLCWSRVFIWHL